MEYASQIERLVYSKSSKLKDLSNFQYSNWPYLTLKVECKQCWVQTVKSKICHSALQSHSTLVKKTHVLSVNPQN